MSRSPVRSATGRSPRLRSVGAGVLVGLAVLTSTVLGAPAARAADSLPDGSVKLTVLDMSPTTAASTATASPLTFTLAVTNTTDQTIGRVELDADRDPPINSASRLSSLLAKPAAADRGSLQSMHSMPLPSLGPHQTIQVTYAATTSTTPQTDICLCFSQGIYPIDFTLRAAHDSEGSLASVAFAQTFLPSFEQKPSAVQVSWVWPLIDRPHRVSNQDVFVDDDLAASVSPGGRLDRALTVVEQVAAKAHLSLVVDPELIDELSVMSTHYQVRTATGALVTGTGGPVALAFLERLKAVAPLVDVSLTDYADPDVNALTRVGLDWNAGTSLPDAEALQVRLVAALGTGTHDDVAWPADQKISNAALDHVVGQGASTVLLDGSQFANSSGLNAIAPLSQGTGTTAVVTDAALQKLAASVITEPARGGSGTQQLPVLVSTLAMRAVADPSHTHYVALTADRYVDANPTTATRAILETTTAGWSAPLSLHEATATVSAVSHGALTTSEDSAGQLAPGLLDALLSTTSFIKTFTGALANPADATKLVGQLPFTIAWGTSNAWRTDEAGGSAYTAALNQAVEGWREGVYIARPSNGSYTLASSSAPLFVTVVNTLPYEMKVNVTLVPANGAAGFRADPVTGMTVPAHGQIPLKVGVHVQRAGRFQIMASVTTADGTDLGEPVALNVRSTALGAVGVIITASAGGLLLLLLLLRLIRRIRRGPTPARQGATFVPRDTEPVQA